MCKKPKPKVGTHNNLLSKLTITKWGTSPATVRTTVFAVRSACPAWERSTHGYFHKYGYQSVTLTLNFQLSRYVMKPSCLCSVIYVWCKQIKIILTDTQILLWQCNSFPSTSQGFRCNMNTKI